MLNGKTVRAAITSLLAEMLEKKLIAKQKEVEALLTKGVSESSPKFQSALQSLTEIEASYEYDNWLRSAANSMTKSATLATHISKGVHSMSKGDSVLFKDMGDRPDYLAGSHNIVSDVLDISGSAASLPIYNFINLEVEGVTIKHLIESNDPAIIQALSDDHDTALDLFDKFQGFLVKQVDKPVTSELNKQLLFPKNGDSFEIESVDDLEYETVVPLYASVFCHEVRNSINGIIFSEEYREAIKNRFNKDDDDTPPQEYKTIRNLAAIKLGGSKPANISKVVVMSAGEMLLLSNKPPPVKKAAEFMIPKSISSVFRSRKINRMLQGGISKLARASIKYDQRAIFKTKNNRLIAMKGLIAEIFDLALLLQKNEAGWLADHELPDYEKYWLDPMGASVEGMDESQIMVSASALKTQMISMIALYINDSLALVAGEKAHIFNADNFNEIRKEVEALSKKYQRNNLEIFYEH